jgi:ribose transport system permease protein
MQAAITPGEVAGSQSSPTDEVFADETGRNRIGRLLDIQRLFIFGVLAALFTAFGIAAPTTFLSSFNLINLLSAAAILLVLATGETFVLVTAGVDLSIGSVLVFSGVMAAKVMLHFGGLSASWAGIAAGIAAGLFAGVVWGALNGFLVAWAGIPSLIVTLGTLGAALGLAEVWTDGNDLSLVPTRLVNSLGIGKVGSIPIFVIIAAIIVLLSAIVLNLTRFGRHTFAIGASQEAARRAGINVRRHLLRVYSYQGFLAGLAGVLSLARFSNTTLAAHEADNLAAITAVVVGGTSLFGGYGSIGGTVIGAFIPVVLLNGLVILNMNSFWQQVVIGAILVLAVYVDQQRRSSRT